jgi:hypothetical protein
MSVILARVGPLSSHFFERKLPARLSQRFRTGNRLDLARPAFDPPRSSIPAHWHIRINMPLAQIELREGLPFEVTTRPPVLLNSEQQAAEWQEALGIERRS